MFVDSNVILDVATDDPKWGAWSENALAEAARTGPLVINAVVFAEVSVGYERVEEADLALPADVFLRAPIPYEAAFLAAKAFIAYEAGRGGVTAPSLTSSSAPTPRWPVSVC